MVNLVQRYSLLGVDPLLGARPFALPGIYPGPGLIAHCDWFASEGGVNFSQPETGAAFSQAEEGAAFSQAEEGAAWSDPRTGTWFDPKECS